MLKRSPARRSEVVALGIDRHHERAEFLDPHHPQRLGHAEVEPLHIGDLLDLLCGNDSTASRERAVDRAEFAAGFSCLIHHAALPDYKSDPRLTNEISFKRLHTAAGGGSDRNHELLAVRVAANYRACMEYGAILK